MAKKQVVAKPYPKVSKKIFDRMSKKLKKVGDCLVWTGSLTYQGYGQFMIEGKNYRIHRLFWVYHKGRASIYKVMDHICRNRACCNVNHLRLVTQKENALSGVGVTAANSRKTHCDSGHRFTDSNIYRMGRKKYRMCRKCHVVSVAKYKKKQRQALSKALGEKL